MLGVLVGKLSLTNACLPIPPVPLETLIQALQFVLPSPLCPWDLCISCTQGADRGLRLVWKTLGFCKITHYTFLPLEACSHFQMDTIVTASPCKFWTWETQMLDGRRWLWPVFVSVAALPHAPRRKSKSFITSCLAWSPAWLYDYHLLQFTAASILHDINIPSNLLGIF